MEGITLLVVAVSVLIGFVGVIIVSKKEKQRREEYEKIAKPCERIVQESCMSRISDRAKFVLMTYLVCFVGFIIGIIPAILPHIDLENFGNKSNILLLLIIFCVPLYALLGIRFEICLTPLFAVTDDSFIIWNNYGFGAPKKYLLSELTRSRERYVRRGRKLITLYNKGEYVQDIDINSYNGEDAEILKRIPVQGK